VVASIVTEVFTRTAASSRGHLQSDVAPAPNDANHRLARELTEATELNRPRS
jgi:hypothetical protein